MTVNRDLDCEKSQAKRNSYSMKLLAKEMKLLGKVSPWRGGFVQLNIDKEQARQFGIATCTADTELPDEFKNGDKILVVSVQKFFNGLTRFGLNRQSAGIETFLMDDAHACADRIREQCRTRIPAEEPAYNLLKILIVGIASGLSVILT